MPDDHEKSQTYSKNLQLKAVRLCNPVNRGRNLNVLCTFKLQPVSTRKYFMTFFWTSGVEGLRSYYTQTYLGPFQIFDEVFYEKS